MKASEMTNEEIAKHIECGDAILREAAARLRALSTLTTHTDNSKVIAELQRRLKVVADALKEAVDEFCANCTASDDDRRELCDRCVTLDWKEALAEIQNQP